MKVGILSLTSGYNFGGTLQTVALSRTLQRLGHDVTVLDYWPTPPRKIPPWRGWGLAEKDRLRRIRSRFAELRHLGKFRKKYEVFKNEELKWSLPCFDKASFQCAAGEMDAIVVGSDQVWNLSYHPDPNFYLSDFDDFSGRRISYAACCGNPAQGCPSWVPIAFEKFDRIGVRNKFTADWVTRCCQGRIFPEVVADPTLLIDDYPRRDITLPDKYIASYLIGAGSSIDDRRGIEELRRRHGDLPVICLMPTGVSIRFHGFYDRILWNLDPFDWVEIIRRATVVHTDSFHAVLFAMRNRVQFLATYVEAVRAPRLIELRDHFGLGQMVQPASKLSIDDSDPDWDRIRLQIDADRAHSLEFLETSLVANYFGKAPSVI
jgi:hypothetical protein